MKRKMKSIMAFMLALVLTLSVSKIETEAANVSKNCTVTFNNVKSDVSLTWSNGSIATVKKLSNAKYSISNVKNGSTRVTLNTNDYAYTTTADVSVNSKGYPTLTFSGDKSITIESSNPSVVNVTTTTNSNGTKTFKVKYKANGTAKLTLSINGTVYTSCTLKIS